MLGRATDTQDSPRPGLGGNHHLPPYSILCTSPQGPHPNVFLSHDFLQLWGAITLRANLWLRWGLNQSFSPCRELSNGMLHAICTHENRVDSQLLMVGNQTANLIPNPSFDHNLKFGCSNGRCEPILDIYVSRASHWYKELFKPLSFDPYNRPLKIRESTKTPTPQSGTPLGCEGSFPHTFSHPREYVVRFSVSLLACNLANPCLGREPKARVTTSCYYCICTLGFSPDLMLTNFALCHGQMNMNSNSAHTMMQNTLMPKCNGWWVQMCIHQL